MKKRGIIFASGIGLAIIAFVTLAPIIPPPPGPAAAETDPVYLAAKDTDGTLAANSDAKVATQKAAKTYSDTKQTAAQVQALIDAGGFLTPSGNGSTLTGLTQSQIAGLTTASSPTFAGLNIGGVNTGGVVQLAPISGQVISVFAGTNGARFKASNNDFSAWESMEYEGNFHDFYQAGVLSMRVGAGVNIGGTSDPGAGNLNVNGRLDAVSGTQNTAGDATTTYAAVTAANVILGSGSGNAATLMIQSNSDLGADLGGSIGFSGRYITASTAQIGLATIKGAKENSTSNNLASYLAFGTRADGGNITEKMRINAAGNVKVLVSLTIGVDGTPITLIKSATATLDFPSTAAGTSSDLTITLTGAAVGDTIALGVPNGSVVANGSYSAWVSAADTITVRYLNSDLVTAGDPASATFRGSLVQF